MKENTEQSRLHAAFIEEGWVDISGDLYEAKTTTSPTCFRGLIVWLRLAGAVILEPSPPGIPNSPRYRCPDQLLEPTFLDADEIEPGSRILVHPSLMGDVPRALKEIEKARDAYTKTTWPAYQGGPKERQSWESYLESAFAQNCGCIDTEFGPDNFTTWAVGIPTMPGRVGANGKPWRTEDPRWKGKLETMRKTIEGVTRFSEEKKSPW